MYIPLATCEYTHSLHLSFFTCVMMSFTTPQQIEVDYLSTLLEGQSPDPMSAHRVLDSLLEDKVRLRVCESVLEQQMKDAAAGALDHVETTIFILHYITSKLGKVVGEGQRIKYVNWLLGAKVSGRKIASCTSFFCSRAICFHSKWFSLAYFSFSNSHHCVCGICRFLE